VNLTSRVKEAFSDTGVISQSTPEFIARDGQLQMALGVAKAIEEKSTLVVEAATGVGKTFAYLAPVLLSGKKAIISTASKTLQDQLFTRDLPHLAKCLKTPIRGALLKGRANYLCLHRLQQARYDKRIGQKSYLESLAKVERWSQETRSGDLAEVSEVSEKSTILHAITSTKDNCLLSDCPQYQNCYVYKARKHAWVADVIVINHHLFFASLAINGDSHQPFLPKANIYILDEAHQLNETGIYFLGKQLATQDVVNLARDLLTTGVQGAQGLQKWTKIAEEVEQKGRDLRLVAGHIKKNIRLSWEQDIPEQIDPVHWKATLHELSQTLEDTYQILSNYIHVTPDFGRLAERTRSLQKQSLLFSKKCTPGHIRWVDIHQGLTMVESPLDIGDTIQEELSEDPSYNDQLTKKAVTQDPTNTVEKKSWIFTSATLGNDKKLTWFTSSCGLAHAEILKVHSPFDYAKQAALYLPKPFPNPQDIKHSEAVANLVVQGVKHLGGKTMVLTTTLKALETIAKVVYAELSVLGIRVLTQGKASKRTLIKEFTQSVGKKSVLLASVSFWEGIDIPNNALQLLFIDKLPFPPPYDPLVKARCESIQKARGNPFYQYYLTEAAILLKQGAGRLIRRENDKGVLTICDPRIYTMPYGKGLIRTLGDIRLLTNKEAWLKHLQEL
jgi:ATP-dependent DNA helicase DinG